MQVMKWSVIALAVAAGTSQMAVASEQSEAKGFLDDSHLTLTNRNYYFNHDGKDDRTGDGRDWSHAMLLNYTSGFTQGVVGFGVDAFAIVGLRLDSRMGGAGNVPNDNDGSKEEWSRIGGAVKARISNTTLKYGTQQPTAPVFATGGSRITPQYATGFSLVSNEISNLMLEGGHFTSTSGPRSMGNNEELYAAYAGVSARQADFIGGKYNLTDNLSFQLYGAQFKDVWDQYYGNVNWVIPLADTQALTFDFNMYHTKDEGSAKAGDIDTNVFSLAAAYSVGAHTFTVAFQKNNGDTPFDYVGVGNEDNTGDSIFLANSVHVSDFNGPNEKSYQVRYDLNMKEFGAPGLSFMARYLNGWGADYTHMDLGSAYLASAPGTPLDADGNPTGPSTANDGKHHEINFEAKYVVQSGPAKDLSFRLRQAFHRSNSEYADGDTNQTRLMVEYPLSIL